jgi:mRNA interferase MazF
MKPSRGEVWLVNLNPTKGHEQAGKRPALVLSVDAFNHGPADLVIVVPLTTTDRGIRSHIRIEPPEGGCTKTSFIKAEEIRCISTQRLLKLKGTVGSQVMAEVAYALRILLDLY